MKRFEPGNPDSTSLLRIARMARGVTQQELAEKSDLTRVAISHIESGKTQPFRRSKRWLAEALDYEVSDIFPPEGKKSTSKELRQLLAKDLRRRKVQR